MFRVRFATIPAPIVLSIPRITTTREGNEMAPTLVNSIVNAAVFAFLGIVVFTVVFVVMDKVTPYHLWKEIVQEHNTALAILVGAMSIGICIIIAAAVH